MLQNHGVRSSDWSVATPHSQVRYASRGGAFAFRGLPSLRSLALGSTKPYQIHEVRAVTERSTLREDHIETNFRSVNFGHKDTFFLIFSTPFQ